MGFLNVFEIFFVHDNMNKEVKHMGRLYLLPGLGANQKIFHYQKQWMNSIVVPDWLEPLKDESLSHYALRWSKSFDFQSGDSIGGMSFGGQVALELARHLPFERVFLISANRRYQEISSLFKFQTRLLQNMPESVVRLGLKSIALPQLMDKENLKPQEVEWLEEMISNMDFSFFKWACLATSLWDYEYDPSEFNMPIHQIRGELDSIIQHSKVDESYIISGAHHLINYTHAVELNQWLSQKITDQSRDVFTKKRVPL